MTNIKLNEQIAFLRKQNNMTQEDLAKALGVSNQAVSKWESGQCYPDIQLLPELSKIFNVSIDILMGFRTTDTFENIYLNVKTFFETEPAETSFHNAFRLAILLHEVAVTRGYKDYCPWNTELNHGLEEHPYKWGYSACSEPEGNTIYTGNGIFIASGETYQSPTSAQLRNLFTTLNILTDKNVLKVMYTLYEMTVHNFDSYVSLSAITAKAGLTETETLTALENLPLSIKAENGNLLYRMEGAFMHIPPLLLMLREK